MIKSLIIAMCFLAPLHANAILISTANNGDFEIETVTGTFTDLNSRLSAEPWWGNFGLAQEISDLIGNLLGTPPPKVLVESDSQPRPGNDAFEFQTWFAGGSANGCSALVSEGGCFGISHTWAVTVAASQVPVPGTLGLIACALLGITLARRWRV